MAELDRHMNFKADLDSFKGSKEEKYFLEIVASAIAKNPSYTAGELCKLFYH